MQQKKYETYGKKELIERVLTDEKSTPSVEKWVDVIVNKLFDILKEGKSFQYDEDTPLIKTKISKANISDNSPRTARRDHIICTIKIKE